MKIGQLPKIFRNYGKHYQTLYYEAKAALEQKEADEVGWTLLEKDEKIQRQDGENGCSALMAALMKEKKSIMIKGEPI